MVQQSEGRNRCKFWQGSRGQTTATNRNNLSVGLGTESGSQRLTTSLSAFALNHATKCHKSLTGGAGIVLQSLAISLSEKAQTTATNGNNLSVGLGPIYRQKTTQPLCRAGERKGSQMAIFRAVFIISANRNKSAPRGLSLRGRCRRLPVRAGVFCEDGRRQFAKTLKMLTSRLPCSPANQQRIWCRDLQMLDPVHSLQAQLARHGPQGQCRCRL